MENRPLNWKKIELIKKSLLEELDEKESSQFAYWYRRDEEFRKSVKELSDKSNLRIDLSRYGQIDQNKSWERLIAKVGQERDDKVKTLDLSKWYRYAAILVGLFVSTFVVWDNFRKTNAESQNMTYKVAPGKDQAVLRLSNGEEKLLANSFQGEVFNNGPLSVFVNNNTVHFKNEEDKAVKSGKLNELETAVGGRYQMELPDGTKVWLNAQTKLQFPDHFGENVREVKLWGEAYFEVDKDADRPFIVRAFQEGLDEEPTVIKVLGTHFNIMAYADEPNINTTLLEGSVVVNHTGEQVLLIPGEQALTESGTTSIKVKKANIKSVIGWKNRMFVFENEPLESIMRKIGRWYNVNVVYNSDIKGKKFSGMISQENEIMAVIDLLEATEEINISFESKSTLLIK